MKANHREIQGDKREIQRDKEWLKEIITPFLNRIREARELDIYPYFREFQNVGPRVWIDDRQFINFTSNDYLGLSQHPALIEAAQRAVENYGTGLGSSRIQATTDRHVELEEKLAQWFGYPACMVFTTGYQSLVGVISTFAGPETTLILDNLSHASIIDGMRMARGMWGDKLEIRTFKHNSIRGIRRILKSAKYPKKFLIVEGVYSLDGDIAPVSEMYDLAREYGAAVIVDDAHGIGTLGPTGRGVLEEFGVPRVDFLIGTFSKSFGGVGGFVLAEADVIEFLKNSARSFTFSASLPVPIVEAMLTSLEIMSTDLSYLKRLHRNRDRMRRGLLDIGFDLGTSDTHIMPIVLRSDTKTLEFGAWLYALGVIMIPILYPAVPRGEERLRCNITAAHTEHDIDVTLEILEFVAKKLGVVPKYRRRRGQTILKTGLTVGRELLLRSTDLTPKNIAKLGKILSREVIKSTEEFIKGYSELEGEDIMKLKQFFYRKNVVITGGSSGIGRSLALKLAQLGANLYLVARNEEKLNRVVEELEKVRLHGEQNWRAIPADISKREEIRQKMEELLKEVDVDILINNAGIAYANYIDSTDPEIFEKMIQVNYLGTVWTTLPFIPHFKKRKRGHIGIVSSLAGVLGFVGYAAYAPSKFALMGFADVLRNELYPHNIDVSVLLPPDTDTPQLEEENKTKPPETKMISGKAEVLSPDEVAMTYLKGIAKGKFHIIPGGLSSKIPYFGVHYIPGITRKILDSDHLKFYQKLKKE